MYLVKRLLSGFLALLMIGGIVPAFAEEEEEELSFDDMVTETEEENFDEFMDWTITDSVQETIEDIDNWEVDTSVNPCRNLARRFGKLYDKRGGPYK